MMKKKNKGFDFALYTDAMRQIKTAGIITAVILLIFACLIPVFVFLSALSRNASGKMIIAVQTLSLFEGNLLIPFLVYIMGPVMVLQCFSFLNKRNASDFYHSLPYTRQCLYVTYFAAALTWAVGILLASSLVSCLTIAVLPKTSLLMDSVGYFLLAEFCCMLLTMSITALAAALAGTTFNSVFILVMILFVPRILIAIGKMMVSAAVPFVADESYGFLLNSDYNLVIAMITHSSLVGGESFESVISAGSLGYTFVLAAIYFVLGAVFFVRRKSEAAEHSSANRGIQACFRMLTAFIFCIPAIWIVFSMIQDGIGDGIDFVNQLFFIFVSYVCAVLAYFIYELITTRKWKNCIRILPGLLVLAGINVAVIGGLEGYSAYYRAQRPSAEEIRYVSILSDEQQDYWYDMPKGSEYFSSLTGSVKIVDEEINKIVSKQLDYTIDNWLDQYEKKYDENGEYTVTPCKVKICYGNKTLYCYVLLSEKQYKAIGQKLAENDRFREVYMNLPEEGKNSTAYYMPANGSSVISEEAVSRILDAYREDIQDMGFEQWYGILSGSDSDYYDGDVIIGTTSLGLERYYMRLPIDSRFPKAFQIFMEENNKLTVSRKDFYISLLQGKNDFKDMEINYLDIWVYLYDHPGQGTGSIDFYLSEEDDSEETRLIRELGDYLEGKEDSYFTENLDSGSYVRTTFSYYIELVSQNGNDYTEENGEVILYLPKDETVGRIVEELYQLYDARWGTAETFQ